MFNGKDKIEKLVRTIYDIKLEEDIGNRAPCKYGKFKTNYDNTNNQINIKDGLYTFYAGKEVCHILINNNNVLVFDCGEKVKENFWR